MSQPTYRYPGIRSFQTGEQKLFFGRTEETQDLYHLLKVETLSVLFAKSGIGKTSLIQAGVVPLLQKEAYQPIFVRFQDTSLSPLEQVKASLTNYLDQVKCQHLGSENTLWEWIKASDFGGNKIPVLILDQFEEFFSHQPDQRTVFTEQLAELTYHYLPEQKQEEWQQLPIAQQTPERLAWYRQPPIHILMAIRADRLSLLDEMSDDLPAILHNRFHLKPLNAQQARSAIIQPAQLQGNYSTQPFTYAPKTLDHILQELSEDQQGSIESFQLQLLCGTIEEKVAIQQQATANIKEKEHTPLIVTPDYLKNKATESISEGIKHILNNYYETKIQAFPASLQANIRVFIEDGLIEKDPTDPTQGKRVGILDFQLESLYGLNEKVLKELLETRLIRARAFGASL